MKHLEIRIVEVETNPDGSRKDIGTVTCEKLTYRTFKSGKGGYGLYGKLTLPNPKGDRARFQSSINLVELV